MSVSNNLLKYGLPTAMSGAEDPIILRAKEALRAVRTPDKRGVYASADKLFRGAIFGRDSLEVAEDLLEFDRELIHEILTTLAQLQGTQIDESTDQKPGKIIHEHRLRPKNDDLSLVVFKDVSKNFGGNQEVVTYYGSVDSTPLYIRLLGRYVEHYGVEILDKVVERHDKPLTFRQSLEQATQWLVDEIDQSPYGLLAFCHTNPTGKLMQAWKDSDEFMTHLNGESANFNKPVVAIEVQGLAYDALLYAAKLLPETAAAMLDRADRLRNKTFELLWLEDEARFALGIDMDAEGNWRQILTDTASPAELLDSMLFDDLPNNDRQKYVTALVSHIFTDDFLTNAGVRSRAKSYSFVVPFWDYQGSYTTWPKETFDIARGLYRHGFRQLSQQLTNRLVNAVIKSGGMPEFIYVDLDGNVLVGRECPSDETQAILINNVDKPEDIQAWTASAVYAARHMDYDGMPLEAWKQALQSQILADIAYMPLCLTAAEIAIHYPELAFRRNGKARPNSNFFYQHTELLTSTA